jgi:hypothetical protein
MSVVRLPGCHRANARNDVGGPPCIIDHALSQFTDIGKIRLGMIQQTRTHFAVCDDGSQRLVDLVGNGSRQLAEHRQARGMRKLCLYALKHFLRSHSLRDVNNAHQADVGIGSEPGPGGGREHVDDAPIQCDDLGLLLKCRFAAPAAFQTAHEGIWGYVVKACESSNFTRIARAWSQPDPSMKHEAGLTPRLTRLSKRCTFGAVSHATRERLASRSRRSDPTPTGDA